MYIRYVRYMSEKDVIKIKNRLKSDQARLEIENRNELLDRMKKQWIAIKAETDTEITINH